MSEGRKPVAGGSWSSRFTREQWWLLPLPLRIRWWQETGMRVPSPELVEAVKAALAVKEPTGELSWRCRICSAAAAAGAGGPGIACPRSPKAKEDTEALARRSNGS
jgi:hypothetical protein